MDEAGVPGYEATLWLGLMAPKDTPSEAVEKLNAALTRILQSAEIKESWSKLGAEAMVMTPAEFGQFLQRDIQKWAQVVKLSGAKLEP
jgi:tripartite-type tricarboxylate transporter receptor subunit TctC